MWWVTARKRSNSLGVRECWSRGSWKIFEEKFRFAVPTKNYGFKRWYPEKGLTTEQYEKAEDRRRSC
jgi:hypothetical protein